MGTMKAGLYLSEKNIGIKSIEKPTPTMNEVLVKVSYAGICGTDMMIYFGKHPRAKAPLAMGHEFCGTIEEINGEMNFSIGDRVVVEPTISCGKCDACQAGQYHVCKTLGLIGIDQDGGFAEYVTVPIDRLHRIPENLSDDLAALTEPVAVAVHTVRKSNVKVGDEVAILGAGPIGLLIGLVAKLAGAGQVIISDISPYRLNKAKELGFTVIDAKEESVVDKIQQLTDGRGADVAFEVAGTQITANQMLEIVRFQGQIVVVSVYKQPPTIDLAKMHFRELSLITTRCYSSGDFQKAIQFMATGQLDVGKLVSHKLTLDELQEGLNLMENPDESLKVLIKP